jgi:hypothetical protein
MRRLLVMLCVTALVSFMVVPVASAKRAAPKPVKPVVLDGVKYVAPNDKGRVCYVEAWDVSTEKRLWERIIYEVPVNPGLEEDVQWSFIVSLSVQDGALLVIAENKEAYILDLKTKGSQRRLRLAILQESTLSRPAGVAPLTQSRESGR